MWWSMISLVAILLSACGQSPLDQAIAAMDRQVGAMTGALASREPDAFNAAVREFLLLQNQTSLNRLDSSPDRQRKIQSVLQRANDLINRSVEALRQGNSR